MPERVFRRGDIVACTLARGDGKPRPAVVIQSDLFNPTHASVVVCPLSPDITGLSLFRVPLPPSATSGIRKDSEAMIDKMSAIRRTRIGRRIGRISGSQLVAVDRALRVWLDLPGTSESP